ncbi:FAD-dependent oxidoreductase [Ornithinimicrobium sp. F0845]|uniref:FAD-dependent oxidoreductase n=1 Tax=Ornithinimicrobium sp. F0845 TaxID=2926412 RepID=UPI001FF5310C|nr:FAD-dependent oxidoreductase [Ornithinimicrobium sp. F0845]MCK0113376.1 FAD-dependent oxidoreductase [Ornithinimicrobium sp. F0845]
MTHRIVVIGADAAGMSAAHQALRAARRVGREISVLAFEATSHTSYSACGLPYWVAGHVDSPEDLVARTVEEHRAAGIELRMGTRVTAVDLEARTVTAEGPAGVEEFGYDDVVIATGAAPVVPDWARGEDSAPIVGSGAVTTLDEGREWVERLKTRGDVLVAGGGYIGLEMVEAALARGHRCTLLTRGRFMHSLDPEMGRRVVDAMRRAGVDVREDAEVIGLDVEAGRVAGARTADGQRVPADLVVLALGLSPRTEMVADQLPLGQHRGLLPDARGRADADRSVWAAGDCCEVRHRLLGEPRFLPLGTHANKLGRALGDNLGDPASQLTFDGALGTSITRFVGGEEYLEIAMTGLTEEVAVEAGLDVLASTLEGTTASGYMPEAEPIAIRVVAERGTRRLLGVQIVGGHGAGKRVDAAAAVLWSGGTVDDLAWMDLAYAPPFATSWEVLSVAARRVAERL